MNIAIVVILGAIQIPFIDPAAFSINAFALVVCAVSTGFQLGTEVSR